MLFSFFFIFLGWRTFSVWFLIQWVAIDDVMYLIYPLREEWFSLITEKVSQKPLSVEAPLCSRICAWKNPQVARTLIDTHFPGIYMAI